MSSSVNPYAAPAARVDDVPANAEAEAIRREHINTEASLKAVGFLYYLGGVLVLVAGIVSLGGRPTGDDNPAVIGALLIALSVAQAFAGYGVRALLRWGRVLGCILSAIGLLGFPFGTLINGYILYLFLSKKGRTVFSPEYKDVIASTPHVKYRTSIIVWIFLALLVGLILVGVGAALFA